MEIKEIVYTSSYGNNTIILYFENWKHIVVMTSGGPPKDIRKHWPNDHKRSIHRYKIDSVYTGPFSISPYAFMNKKRHNQFI